MAIQRLSEPQPQPSSRTRMPSTMPALAIVRSSEGLASAVDAAREYVERAEACCDDFPDSDASTALRTAPRALLESVSVTA